MCLLIVLTRVRPDFPLVVGANRDERYDRPAVPMAVLRPSGPRVLGGRDELAGGSWLVVNDAGVFAGVTNTPSPAGRDPTRRSRGELPLLLAAHRSAGTAVDRFLGAVDPRDYNPVQILVGDRTSLFALDMGGGGPVRARALAPGVHVLENRPLGAPSPKVERVRGLLGDVRRVSPDELGSRLRRVLRDHVVPDRAGAEGRGPARPAEADAACVHTERYGTRWSGVVTVPAAPGEPPRFGYTEGAPCGSPSRDASALLRAPDPGTPGRADASSP